MTFIEMENNKENAKINIVLIGPLQNFMNNITHETKNQMKE